MTEAEYIVYRLTKKTRHLWARGYESVRLLISDDSFVRAGDWEPSALEQLEKLLRAGQRPLGFVARLSERRGQPFVEPWVSADEAALAKLKDAAQFWYHHRM
jgi:hypothetical protein